MDESGMGNTRVLFGAKYIFLLKYKGAPTLYNFENMSDRRQSDFKSGLGQGDTITRRHREKNSALRRIKRDRALHRIRGVAPDTKSSEDAHFQALLEEYSRNPSLLGLHTLFQKASESQIATHICTMLRISPDNSSSPIIQQLIQKMGSIDSSEAVRAMECLVHITSLELNGDEEIFAKIIVQNHFLDGVALAHIQEDTPIALEVWKLVVNLINVCEQSRDAVLHSPLFTVSAPNAVPPFLLELKKCRPHMQKVLIQLMCSTLEAGNNLPPKEYIITIWPYVISYLMQLMPAGRNLDPNGTGDLECMVNDLCVFLYFLEQKAQQVDEVVFFGIMLLQSDDTRTSNFIGFLVKLIPRLPQLNQWHVARFLVKVSSISSPELWFMSAMKEAQCLHVMVRLMQSPNERLQRAGITWIMNFCADGLDCVAAAIDANIIGLVVQMIRSCGLKYSLMRGVIGLITSVCNACVCELQNPSCSKRASGYLAAIVNDVPVIQTTVKNIRFLNDVQSTCDILDLWLDLLRWEPKWASEELEKYGAENELQNLMDSKNNSIFERVDAVTTILDREASSYNSKMELELPTFGSSSNINHFSF